MEKLVYVCWKPDGAGDDRFRDSLLETLPGAIDAAGGTRLSISAVDSHVAASEKLRLGPMQPPKSGIVSLWLEAAQDREPFESALRGLTSRRAGYLVVESRPLVGPEPDAPGGRCPGFNLVGCIERREDLSREEFVRHWHGVHRGVAIETQSSFGYTRNEVVRALTPDAPAWDAIVEEGFPVEALDDPHAFYDAVGSELRYRENLKRMVDSCRAFIALDRVESHPMSEYRF